MEVGQKRPLEAANDIGGSLVKNLRTSIEPVTIQKSTIRVRDNLTAKPLASTLTSNSSSATEAEMKLLKEEVRALTWLARRKEQEWDAIVRLLKQKEERLLRTERQLSLEKSGHSTFLRTDLSNSGVASSKLDVGPIPEISNKKFASADHLTSYFNLAKSVTVLQDTSGNPIVVQVLPDSPKLQVQDSAVVALLPKVPLPSTAVVASSSTNGLSLTPTIVSTTSLAPKTSIDNSDIEIISAPSVTKPLSSSSLSLLRSNSSGLRPAGAGTSTSPIIRTRIVSSSTPYQASRLISPTSSSTSGPTGTSPASKIVVSKPSSSLLISNSPNSKATIVRPTTSLATSGSKPVTIGLASTAGTPGAQQNSNAPSRSTTASMTLTAALKAAAVQVEAKTPDQPRSADVSPPSVESEAAPVQVNPKCEFCRVKVSQFLCAGCSNRSYCSRACQEKDWDTHCDDCN